ncbi:MAG: putative rane protein, partial [Verrucomicrobiales bacterium]|nr:putative rane protein [Verrucomicrobiales bacterium]
KHWGKFALVSSLSVAAVLFTSWWMVHSTSDRVFQDAKAIPANNVGLVLGTSPRLKSGNLNWHFKVRMEAAAKLFREGKVQHLLVSGDNHILGYDEPTEMKDALVKLGVPETDITLDYAGFRTLDSVVRAKAIFGQTKMTIVTEDFHAHRSAFLAQHFGVDAVVFCAQPLDAKWTVRMQIRELGARCKAALDAYVLHTKPKFLGDKIEIKLTSRSNSAGRS